MAAQVDIRLVLSVRNREPTPCTDALDGISHPASNRVHHLADLCQVFQVGPRPDVHVQSRDGDLVAGSCPEALFYLFMPDTMF